MSSGSWITCALLLLAGCPAQMNYAYQETLPASAFGPGETAEDAGREARQLLASARTVAFFPPDHCINVVDDKVQDRRLRAHCGVLLSTLERAAEKAGYEVVSWQNLRGREKRPIDYAREARVDVLFEINEFDLRQLDDDKLARSIGYVKHPTGGAVTAFTPPADVDARCVGYAGARRKAKQDARQPGTPGPPVAKQGIIDIKTVSVVDGRNRWRYRKSLTKPRGVEYEQLTFTAAEQVSAGGIVLSTVGGIGLITGGTLQLVSGLSTDEPTTDMDERVRLGSFPIYLIAASAAVLAGGIVLAVRGAKPGGPEGMCLDGVVPSSMWPGKTPTVDEEAEDTDIRDAMINEFIDVIIDVRKNAPPLPPPPAPVTSPTPAPAPAPAPAPGAP